MASKQLPDNLSCFVAGMGWWLVDFFCFAKEVMADGAYVGVDYKTAVNVPKTVYLRIIF